MLFYSIHLIVYSTISKELLKTVSLLFNAGTQSNLLILVSIMGKVIPSHEPLPIAIITPCTLLHYIVPCGCVLLLQRYAYTT